jgi:hypothetical protein
VTGEAGLFLNHPPSGFDAALGFTLAVGYRVSSSFELRAGAEMVDAGHALDSIALVGGIGYSF